MHGGMNRFWGPSFGANAWGGGYALRAARRASKAARMHALRHRSDNIRQTDFKTEVGEAAGEICRLLEGRGKVRLKELREGTRHKGTAFMAALGWLMREDKVDVVAAGHDVCVKLKA